MVLEVGPTLAADSVEEDTVHLWSSILKEVSNAGLRKLPQNKSLIFLGDHGTGKSTVACRLKHGDPSAKSYGLEYHFIDIKDEARDDQTKLGIWILDGEVTFAPLLNYAIHNKNFSDCMAVIFVSMDEAWAIMEQLKKWTEILERYIEHLNIPVEQMSECKENLIRQLREYIEPDTLLMHETSPIIETKAPFLRSTTNPLHPATVALLGLSQSPVKSAKSPEVDLTDEANKPTTELPLTPGALVNNLGIPIVVVVTKTDVMETLEKENNISEEQFDLIQMHIRKFCLSYGAALFYVSTKEDKNCELLKNYIQHRIYGFPFTGSAYVVEKDCIFVPTGWDNLKKISILEENLTKFRSDDEYSVVMPTPEKQAKSTLKEPEVSAIDEQLFLTHIFAKMQRDANAGTGGTGPGGDGLQNAEFDQLNASVGTPRSRPTSGSPRNTSIRTKSNVNTPNSMSGNTSENVLASFFNNLLTKRPSAANTIGHNLSNEVSTPEKASVSMTSKEIHSELERMTKSPKEASEEVSASPSPTAALVSIEPIPQSDN